MRQKQFYYNKQFVYSSVQQYKTRGETQPHDTTWLNIQDQATSDIFNKFTISTYNTSNLENQHYTWCRILL